MLGRKFVRGMCTARYLVRQKTNGILHYKVCNNFELNRMIANKNMRVIGVTKHFEVPFEHRVALDNLQQTLLNIPKFSEDMSDVKSKSDIVEVVMAQGKLNETNEKVDMISRDIEDCVLGGNKSELRKMYDDWDGLSRGGKLYCVISVVGILGWLH